MATSDSNNGATRRFRTALGVVTTRECLTTQLQVGERFVGPDGTTVYQVRCRARSIRGAGWWCATCRLEAQLRHPPSS
jgi:hypothetical protein